MHELCFQALYALVETRAFRMPWSAALTQAVVNGVVGIVAFQIVESGPGLLQRRRARGATLSRRQLLEASARQGWLPRVHDQAMSSNSSHAAARRSPQPEPAAVRDADRRGVALCRAGGRRSGCSRSRSTRSSTRWRRTTTAAACRCRRRAACCSTATARSSSRTRTPSTSRSIREQSGNIDETLRAPGGGHRRRRSADARDGQPPAARAELPADRADRERDARAGHRGRGAPPRAARHHRAGSADAAVSAERDGGAPVRLRRRGERSGARRSPSTPAPSPGRSSGRPASSRRTTSC